MTDKVREEFEKWFLDKYKMDCNATDTPVHMFTTGLSAWQHQQQKIDRLREALLEAKVWLCGWQSAERQLKVIEKALEESA